MWQARTKDELIIEVWEKLDCENVGTVEIEAIEVAVAAKYGTSAVDSPMMIARLLADEGAELRHSEVMELYLKRASEKPYDAAFRNILRLGNMRSALGTLRDLENLRRKFRSAGDKEGLRSVRETALRGKRHLMEAAERPGGDDTTRNVNLEIIHWFNIWLQTPEFFDGWIEIRQRSADFVERFGKIRQGDED
jgi:hypothetical protein